MKEVTNDKTKKKETIDCVTKANKTYHHLNNHIDSL